MTHYTEYALLCTEDETKPLGFSFLPVRVDDQYLPWTTETDVWPRGIGTKRTIEPRGLFLEIEKCNFAVVDPSALLDSYCNMEVDSSMKWIYTFTHALVPGSMPFIMSNETVKDASTLISRCGQYVLCTSMASFVLLHALLCADDYTGCISPCISPR